MRDLKAEIVAATDTRDPEEYIRRVKNVMQQEIERLDPHASVANTHYFNHSAIPDFFVSWGKSERQRPIYIRDEMANVAAARDAEFLPDDSAAVITLDLQRAPSEVHESVADQVSDRPDTLITSVSALDDLEDPPETSSPITRIVRSQFIRGARGLLDDTALQDLFGSSQRAEIEIPSEESIEEHFIPESARLISRTTELLLLARDHIDDENRSHRAFEGRLSSQELSSILPWLLKDREEQPSEKFLGQLGRMFDFADLETLHEELEGLDLTRLIEANLDNWTATRAYVGLYLSPEGDVELDRQLYQSPEWNFRQKTIGLDLPEQSTRILVAHNGSKLRGSRGTSSATWEKVQPLLRKHKPLRVSLQGLRRSVVVNAEESDDIRQDIADIAETVEDKYYVKEVAVSARGAEDEAVVLEVDLGRRLAISSQDCLLGDITQITRDLLVSREVEEDERSAE